MNGITQRCPTCGRAGWQFAHRSDPSTPIDLHQKAEVSQTGTTLVHKPLIRWQELIAICSHCRTILPMQ